MSKYIFERRLFRKSEHSNHTLSSALFPIAHLSSSLLIVTFTSDYLCFLSNLSNLLSTIRLSPSLHLSFYYYVYHLRLLLWSSLSLIFLSPIITLIISFITSHYLLFLLSFQIINWISSIDLFHLLWLSLR